MNPACLTDIVRLPEGGHINSAPSPLSPNCGEQESCRLWSFTQFSAHSTFVNLKCMRSLLQEETVACKDVGADVYEFDQFVVNK